MPTIIEMFGMRPVKLVKPDKYFVTQPQVPERVESLRSVGIEVEVENALNVRGVPSGVWQPTNDGSLRNNGMEYITHPIQGRWAPYALRELMTEVFPDDCCFSPRTSVHVHVNCQDLTPVQVTDIVLLYGCLEPLFYQFTGRGRVKNIYCVPIFDTNLIPFFTTKKLENAVNEWKKYTGFNLLPLLDKGTLEFRHMHGTFDHQKLSVWVRLILKMVDYAVAQGTPTIRRMVLALNRQSDLFGMLMAIFGDDGLLFKNVEWELLEKAVGNTKLAFMKQETQAALTVERTTKSAYFIK